eukprot:TRINITY_DN11478_c0_g1_i1.p1 TRINITY_DN11478_c0_g1~~TRINITY_DN11478_c0_g1_i1.p1  ORF type:complete len:256 (-),score=87.95 TRINITY_DN11478_c0_g1_i1:118-825(-)
MIKNNQSILKFGNATVSKGKINIPGTVLIDARMKNTAIFQRISSVAKTRVEENLDSDFFFGLSLKGLAVSVINAKGRSPSEWMEEARRRGDSLAKKYLNCFLYVVMEETEESFINFFRLEESFGARPTCFLCRDFEDVFNRLIYQADVYSKGTVKDIKPTFEKMKSEFSVDPAWINQILGVGLRLRNDHIEDVLFGLGSLKSVMLASVNDILNNSPLDPEVAHHICSSLEEEHAA